MTLLQSGIDYICQNFGDTTQCVVSTGLQWQWTDIDNATGIESGGTAQVVSRLTTTQLITRITMISPRTGEYTYAQLRTANGGNDVTLADCDMIILHDETPESGYMQWCYTSGTVTCWRCNGTIPEQSIFPAGTVCGLGVSENYPYATQPICAGTDCTNPVGADGSTACINGYWNTCAAGVWIPTAESCQVTNCALYKDQTACTAGGCYWYTYLPYILPETCHGTEKDQLTQTLIYAGLGIAGLAFLLLLFRR